MSFQDRRHAGRRLAAALERFRERDVVVLGLPRGGVPVAAAVARELDAPLDVILVRKLGVPGQPELAMGAIGEDGVRVLDAESIRWLRITEPQLSAVEARERAELDRRARRYRSGRQPVAIKGRAVIIVDDGIATGATAAAACQVARRRGASSVIMAAPVASADAVRRLGHVADEVVCLETPEPFQAVGLWYVDFSQTSDAEVELLLRGQPELSAREVQIDAGPVTLEGTLTVPDGASGVVVFAHGSGSSRLSPRNRQVAEFLNQAGFATLLFDLLTATEQRDRRNVFDIDLLGSRLAAATKWLTAQSAVHSLPVGFFGASTGAAAALSAAANADIEIAAIVSRGGRPDLAGPKLGNVRAPTLLIVGSRDTQVVELNRRVVPLMNAECRLVIVPGATHLFEEPGTLRAAAAAARDWFEVQFRSHAAPHRDAS